MGTVEITEIRVSLTENNADRLRAFCSITFDDMFVIRDIKIIEGTSGPFVAMPSRRIMAHCPKCKNKNHLKAHFCNECGEKQPKQDSDKDGCRFYADIAHPINSECREYVQEKIISEFNAELERSNQPGYQRQPDDDEVQLLQRRTRVKPPHSRPTDLPHQKRADADEV